MSRLNLVLNLSKLILPIVFTVSPAWGHKIKADRQVGAMVHFEPNDQPKSQESTQVWFALTKKGGTLIPLQKCRCQLQLWQNKKKIATPVLQAINAEKYQDAPSARLLFPQPGAYVLELSGQAVNPGDFQPFRLEFDVTVATGATFLATISPAITVLTSPKINQKAVSSQDQLSSAKYWLLGVAVLGVLGTLVYFKQRSK